MNRRQLIKTFGVFGVFSAVGYKMYDLLHTPDYPFLDKQHDLIAEIAETIIPRTNTPGAKDAKVASFVIYATKEILGKIEKNEFIDGLKDLDNHCVKSYSKHFEQCSNAERIETLNYMSKGIALQGILLKAKHKLLGRNFSEILKELVAIGYCTSEAGATQGLAYDHVPGAYYPCIPLEPGQKSWATK